MRLESGLIVGDLVLIRKLAEGGMGSIWVAEHQTLKRRVAVKFLTRERHDAPEATERFSREARIVTRIRHPHVPKVFEYGFTPDGTPFLVMTLLEGPDLTKWMASYGRPTLAELGCLLEQIGTALDAVHELGIVHRDVTPANIILAPGDASTPREFHAYLIDFGIAKWREPDASPMVTHPGTTVGTPSYMSPEQLMGSTELDERADIWSLGVVAYLCLTGELPFVGKTFREQCLAIYCGKYTPVTELRSDLPAALDTWFAKVLCGDLEQRFSSVAAMSHAFRVAIGEAGPDRRTPEASRAATANEVTVKLPAIPPRVMQRAARRPRGSRATMACALGGATVGAFAAYFITAPHPSPAAQASTPTHAEAPRVLPAHSQRDDGNAARHSLQGQITGPSDGS
jgi:serine/threonine-protein kinase